MPETDPDDFGTAPYLDPSSIIIPGQEAPRQIDYAFLAPPMGSEEIGWLTHYRVTRLLGAGGMGFVFEAEDTHLRRTVALKVMRPELAENVAFRQRFLEEARAAARLASDHIITVFQVGTAEDVPFLAMQYLHGESLHTRLEREKRLPPNLAAYIARQAAAGLADAHESGLIHRDIKPANLWLEADRPGGNFRRVRILDFGLARPDDRDAKLTASGMIVGTPHFMAPEQAGGHDIDGRADLFSLGCVMYTMLTGQLAFDGKSTMAILMALASRTPPPVDTVIPECPRALSDLIQQLLAKVVDQRPDSAVTVVEELDAILAELPDPMPPVTSSRGTGTIGWGAATRQPYQPIRHSPSPPPAPTSTAETPIVFQDLETPPPTESPATHALVPPPAVAPAPNPASAPIPGSGVDRIDSAGRDWKILALASMIFCCILVLFLGILVRIWPNSSTPTAAVPAAVPPTTPTVEPIPVGVLFSTSGTMSLSESPVADATLLAIDELNKTGGVLGHPLKAIPVDGKSDPSEFARQADRLFTDDHIRVLIGCWTSASRKAVRPVVERHNGLLFYPVHYEGLEMAPRIVYLGPTPNQQLLPALDFLTQKLGKKRLYIIGSDYIFSRAAAEIVRDTLQNQPHVQIVGDAFLPLGTTDVQSTLEAIQEAKPDAILNLINGTTNFHFFRALRKEGISSAELPVLSVSLMETDFRLEPGQMAGHYVAGCYFSSVDSPAGAELLKKFQSRFGSERTLSDPMIAAYAGVHLWARAAEEAQSTEPEAITAVLGRVSVLSPFGEFRVDATTRHAWLPSRIGQIQADGRVKVVAGSGDPIRPIPFPASRTRDQWEAYLKERFIAWNGHWQAPAVKPSHSDSD